MNQIVNFFLSWLNNVSQWFWDYSVGMFVQASLLILVLLAVDFLLRKRVRAVVRYCVWMLVFVKLILPPTLCSPTGIGYWWGGFEKGPAINTLVPDLFGDGRWTRDDVRGMRDDTVSAVTSQVEPPDVIPETSAPPEPSVSSLTPLTWQAILFLLWLVGILVILVLLIQRIRFVKGLIARSSPVEGWLLDTLEQCRCQLGIRRVIQLRLSSNISSPAVCGLFRPIILIPAVLTEKLSPEKLRVVLIHELAHIKRGDLWVNSVQTFLQIIYFYNPFVWLANAIVRRVREQAVDEMVLVALGAEAKDYSNTLIDIAEMAFFRANLALSLISVAESKKSLERRIKHMLTRPIPKTAKVGVFGTIVIIIVAALLLPMAKAQKLNKDDTSVSSEHEKKAAKSLHQAAADGDIEQVKLLISKGADVNAEDEDGYTPYYWAVMDAGKDIVELLTAKGATVISTIHLAARAGDLAKVKRFIEEGTDVDARDKGRETPLFSAVQADNSDVAEFLIAKGADVNAKDNGGATPLNLVTRSPRGRRDMVELLISKGADVNAKTQGGITPLHSACVRGNKDVAELLIAKGANLNAKTTGGQVVGRTPLHVGVARGDTYIVELLISKGAEINIKNSNGRTPLHEACLYGHKNVVELLIAKGADLNAKDNKQQTALSLAKEQGHDEILELLRKHGARE